MKQRKIQLQLDLATHSLADMKRRVVADVRRVLRESGAKRTCVITAANSATEADCTTHTHEYDVDVEQLLVETLNDAVPRVETRSAQIALVKFYARTPRLLHYQPVFRDDAASDPPGPLAGYMRAILYDCLYEASRKTLDC